MIYRIEVDARAVRDLVRLPKATVVRLHEAIQSLAKDPRPPGAKKLTGREGHRVRVGDYRVLYEIDDTTRRVRVYKIGRRKDIYR